MKEEVKEIPVVAKISDDEVEVTQVITTTQRYSVEKLNNEIDELVKRREATEERYALDVASIDARIEELNAIVEKI